MPTIQFDPRIERELTHLAAREGKNLEQLVQDVMSEYLEEQADIEAANAAYDRYLAGQEKTISLDELERRLGLEG
jgi:predicted DNA-binding protein